MSSLRQLVQSMVSIDLPLPPPPIPIPIKPKISSLSNNDMKNNYGYENYKYKSLVHTKFTLETNMIAYFRFIDGARCMQKAPRHTSTLELKLKKQTMTGRQAHERYCELEAKYNSNSLDVLDKKDFISLQIGVKRERARWKRVYEQYMLDHVWVLRYVSQEALQCTYHSLQQQLKQIANDKNVRWTFWMYVLLHSQFSRSSVHSPSSSTSSLTTSASLSERVTIQRMGK